MLRELTSLSLNINNDTLILSSVSEADLVTGGPAYKLSPSLLLGSHIWTMGELVITMDDILVYSHTLSDHQQIIHQVLSTLWEQRLFLKPEKCKFEQKEVEYLRLVISKDHVAMDPMKVHKVTEWLTPTKVKEVQSFLGFVNFYQKFICDFSDIAHPLYALTCKTQQWVWGSPEQEAFNALKKAITVMTSSPGDRKALKGQQTWAQPLGWPLSHRVCWVVSEMVQG